MNQDFSDQTIEQVKKEQKNMFFSGVIILTVANIINKVIGLLFKIPLTNLIGNQGMGYFNTAYNVYSWIYMVSTAGLPVAVSIIISDCRTKGKYKELNNAYKITKRLFLAIGIIGTLLMSLIALYYYKSGNKSYLSMLCIAPTLFFICISSAIRGFFQGYQNMVPTAISQVIESVGKLVLGLCFVYIAFNAGFYVENYSHVDAAFAIFGVTLGVFVSSVFLIIVKKKYSTKSLDFVPPNDETSSSRSLMLKLVKIAIPITISASVLSLSSLIDTTVIPARLQSLGFSKDAAISIYGNYTGHAVPMFNLPPILIYPISYSIIPLISSAVAQKDKKRINIVCNSAFKVASLISIPCTLGMSVLALPILQMFFIKQNAEMAAPLLSVLALSIFSLGILSISNAVLQAHGYEKKPIISMAVAAIVKFVTEYILIGNPDIGIYGAPISTFLCYFTAAAFNMYFVIKYCKIKPAITSTFIKPLIASVFCAGAAYITYHPLIGRLGYSKINNFCCTAVAIVAAMIVYFILIFLLRGIERADVELLPKGKKIAQKLIKMKLLR